MAYFNKRAKDRETSARVSDYEDASTKDSRERRTLQVSPRDMCAPHLHIDTLKVKARNFR